MNQLLKRLVREIRRRASVRAAHRKVRGYSTRGRKTPGYPIRLCQFLLREFYTIQRLIFPDHTRLPSTDLFEKELGIRKEIGLSFLVSTFDVDM